MPNMRLPARWISVDIGFKGGIAIWEGLELAKVLPMPTIKRKKRKAELDKPAIVSLLNGVELAVIEDIHAMPKQGVVSMFRFGYQKGFWEGVCLAKGVEVVFIAPQRWKKVVGLGGLKKKEAKKRAIEIVNREFNLQLKKEDGLADAILVGKAFVSLLLEKELHL
jgi:crossover junction endodeoxyribonuclease RuvC